MAEQQKQSTAGWATILSVLIFPLTALIFLATGASACTPSPTGATCGTPIDLSPSSATKPLLQDLSRYTNPQDFLQKNNADFGSINTELSAALSNPLVTGSSDKDKIVGLINQEQLTVTTIQQAVSSGGQPSAAQVYQFQDLLRQINSYLAICQHCLAVPLIVQGAQGYCGRTSQMMVELFYSHGQIPADLRADLKTLPDGRFATNSASDQLKPEVLDAGTPFKDWVEAPGAGLSSDQLFQLVKRSIDGGDPIILYTYGAIYTSHTNHIVTIVGYDQSDNSFYINNPAIAQYGGSEGPTKFPDHHKYAMTSDYLIKHLGDSYYGHAFMIRQKYLSS